MITIFRASCLHYCDVSMAACGLWPACACVRVCAHYIYTKPRQQKFRAMNGAHLTSPIRGELGYAHWPQLGTQFIALLGTKFGAHYGHNMFALTAAKFVFSNSDNFRAKAIPPKPRSFPKRPFGQCMGQNSSADWVGTGSGILGFRPCWQWRSNGRFSRFKEPGSPTVRGPRPIVSFVRLTSCEHM